MVSHHASLICLYMLTDLIHSVPKHTFADNHKTSLSMTFSLSHTKDPCYNIMSSNVSEAALLYL